MINYMATTGTVVLVANFIRMSTPLLAERANG
jgi:hypothetical protein